MASSLQSEHARFVEFAGFRCGKNCELTCSSLSCFVYFEQCNPAKPGGPKKNPNQVKEDEKGESGGGGGTSGDGAGKKESGDGGADCLV